MFWQPPQGKAIATHYFELYEHTANDVKSVNKDYVVGGPGGAGPAWTKELIEFCSSNNVPIDFTSFHAYGLGGGPSGLDQFGNMKIYLNGNIHFVIDTSVSQQPIIASSSKPNLPVYITEWSASYSPRDPIHDSYFSAPFILEQLRHTELVKCMSYWTFTDVFEENGPVPRPFHGGFGLINYEGIRKPAFWAYKFLSMLGPTELHNNDASSYVCTDGKGGAQVLLWDLTPPTDGGKISNQDYFFKPHPGQDKGNVTVNLSGLQPGQYQLSVYEIGYHQNDPYSRYLEMGSPTDLSREDVSDLKRLSAGTPISQTTVTVSRTFSKTLPLQENSVYLLSLTPRST